MAFDFQDLAQRLTRATKAAFTELLAAHSAEGIYSFALYSDEGALTVCPAANTLAHLATQPAEDRAYAKFEPAEWRYEMVGAEPLFDDVCRLLRTEVLADPGLSDDAFEAFRQQLHDTCTGVLLGLKAENFFQNAAGREVFLYFSVSDGEPEPAALARLVSQLNDNEYRDEYLAWLRTWDD